LIPKGGSVTFPYTNPPIRLPPATSHPKFMILLVQQRLDFSAAWRTGHHIVDSVIGSLPNLALALVILILFLVVAAAIKSNC
jgi:hypothetical protein